MRVEKRFYTENAALWQRAEQKAENERNNQTDRQKEEDQRDAALAAQKIINIVQNDREKHFQVIPGERLDYFERISRSAMELAEAAPFDIVVETEQYYGRISLCAEELMLLPSSQQSTKDILATLIQEADTAHFQVRENGMMELSFVFPFTSEIPRAN